MKGIFRLSVFFSFSLLILIGIWFRSEHINQQAYPGQEESFTQQRAFNDQQAEDLALTIDLFLQQIKNDMIRISGRHDVDVANSFKQEVTAHRHIDGMAQIDLETNEETFQVGTVPANPLEKLTIPQNDKDDWCYSEPYEENGIQKFLIGTERDHKALVAEVDMTFIESFVKDLATLADSQGNFVIGNTDKDVTFSDEELNGDETLVRKEVPGLDWTLFMSSNKERKMKDEYKKGEVIVILRDEENIEKWAEAHDVYVIDKMGQTAVVRDLTTDAVDLMRYWEEDESVIYMEPNYTFEKQASPEPRSEALPNDEFYDNYQWNLKQIELENLWFETTGEEEVITAVLDSGVDGEHTDIQDRIHDGFNAFENNKAFSDENGHGTHVAGIIGAVTNNSYGIAGVTWESPILAVKVLDADAIGNAFAIADGIRWATDNGAKVINLSLGDDHHSEIMYEAVKYAYDHDVALIAATGNDNVDTPMYPAAYEEVLAVGSLNENSERSFFSNFGHHVDVTAPGEHIPSTFVNDQYVMMSGTSMAAPHVAGLVALLRSVQPELSNDEVYEKIRLSATDLGPEGFDPYYGYGRVSASRLLKK
ncbi:S8 family peptidase [Salipaludibacillus sp. LMS25]|jgi:subtilisin family serine protease|uniref:S8 family peptidase n=1 Tax=Salipaludibacillus sp. LMS25 TaxID=2924031 RepID=UPI0020D0A409|nr:S8 family peptidase [Salipaludibacillus sp. LMS25]UTR14703.1 S8 family peptidase [Salipaludibacillus sp. LMS25]